MSTHLEPQRVVPPLHPKLHCPAEQTSPAGQALAQPPQFLGSLRVSTHCVPQEVLPPLHWVSHRPPEQTSPTLHLVLQAPQF